MIEEERQQDGDNAENIVEAIPPIERPASWQSIKLDSVLLARFVPYIETALIVVGLYGMLEWLPLRVFSDGDVRLFAIYNLVHHHQLSHMSYSIIGPAFSIPLVIIDRYTPTMYWWQKHYNVFLLAAAMLLTYVLLRKKIDGGLLRKFYLVLLVASMFGNSVTFYGGEMFTTLGVGFGVLVMLLGTGSAGRLTGWTAIVLGVANTPATLIGLGLMVLKHVFSTRRARYLAAIVAAAGIILGEAWIRRGSPFNSGYGSQAFSTPFFLGLLSILFSFGKGLIFFTPGLLLPVKQSIFRLEHERTRRGLMDEGRGDASHRHRLYEAYTLWICFLVGMILLYSSWWAWDGGWFWGPRFFVFACIPASFALAVRLRQPAASLRGNLLTLGVLLLSLWVGINGATIDQGNLASTCLVNNFAKNGLCQYDPRFSTLWHPFFSPPPFSPTEKWFIAYSLLVALYLALPLLKAMFLQARDLAAGMIGSRANARPAS